MIIITIVSIVVIALLAYSANKIFSWRICPLCAGVSGTWLWMLIGSAAGYLMLENYQLIISVLMGGSVVGIAYQLEKRLAGFRVVLKTTYVILGFTTVYFTVQFLWLEAVVAGILAVIPIGAAFITTKKLHTDSSKVDALEKGMNKCC